MSDALRTYRPRLPKTWWLRSRRYFLYMLREFTVVPIVLWLLSLLVDIWQAGQLPASGVREDEIFSSPG